MTVVNPEKEFAKFKDRAAFNEIIKLLPREYQKTGMDLMDSVVFKGWIYDYLQEDDVVESILPDTSHAVFEDIGTNTHPQIDTHVAAGDAHIADMANPHTTKYQMAFSDFTDTVARFSEQSHHGGLESLVTGQPLDSVPTDINVVNGVSKLYFVLNAGADVTGKIMVTGTKVDRDTGATTGAYEDEIEVTTLSTDNSTPDAQGNVVHEVIDGYITNVWFSGATVISTTDLTLSDVDVYSVAFNQVNDNATIEMKTIDFYGLATNASAWLYYHLYAIEKTSGNMADITPVRSVWIDTVDAANTYQRLRRGNINRSMSGTTDGFWVDMFYGPTSSTYWENCTLAIYFEVTP